MDKNQYSGKYVVFQEGTYFYKYLLKASNGQGIIVSEPYKDKKACLKGIETLKSNVDELVIDFEKDKHKLYCFRIITKQGRALAQSANYNTMSLAKQASLSFKKFVLSDTVEYDDEISKHYAVEIYHGNITPKEKGKLRIEEFDDDSYQYVLLASNGRVLCSSQSYQSYLSCKKAMENFKKCVYNGDFYIYVDKNKKAFFKLYNKQLRLVMTGEVYSSKTAAVNAIVSILSFTKNATFEE